MTTVNTLLPALQYSVSITDSQGRPTPWFQRYWNTVLADRIGPVGPDASPSLPSVAQTATQNTSDISVLRNEVSALSTFPAPKPVPKPEGQDARLQRLEAIVTKLATRVADLEQGPR